MLQDLQKIERYLPLLENLVTCVEGKKNDGNVSEWTSELAIRWTSPLSGLRGRGLKGPRYFQVDDMRFELAMTLNLYGALLRERALEVVCSCTSYNSMTALVCMVSPISRGFQRSLTSISYFG